ncbi:MAG: methyltransferase [Thermoplasmata archaeon]|nr:methyltransferase [Thermoplasmata archaeon]
MSPPACLEHDILVFLSLENEELALGEVSAVAQVLGHRGFFHPETGIVLLSRGKREREDPPGGCENPRPAADAASVLASRLGLARYVLSPVFCYSHALFSDSVPSEGFASGSGRTFGEGMESILSDAAERLVPSITGKRYRVTVQAARSWKDGASVGVSVGVSGGDRVGGRDILGEVSGYIRSALGELLARDGNVDLLRPEREVVVLLGRETMYIGLLTGTVDRRGLEDRKVENRPFFSPISIHPKYARAMINLSGVGERGVVYDPLCGTGGILIEAALMGLEAVGSDIREDMVVGARENGKHFGLEIRTFRRDIRSPSEEPGEYDALVTDPPYGRSTRMSGTLEGILRGVFADASEHLVPGGRVVVCVPDPEAPMRALDMLRSLLSTPCSPPADPHVFEMKESYSIRVHGSLTRHVMVFEKK